MCWSWLWALRKNGNLHSKMPQGLFSKHDPSTTLIPLITYLQKMKTRINTHHMIIYYVVNLSICLSSYSVYNTCSHTSIIQQNTPQVKCMEGFLFKWNEIWLSAEQMKILPTVDYFLAQFLLSTPSCSVISFTDKIRQKLACSTKQSHF